MSSMGGGDDLTIHAELDNDVSPELRNIRDDLGRVGAQAETTGRQASRSSAGFNSLKKAGRLCAAGLKLAFGATIVAGYAAVRLLTSSFAEAREAQKVGATTAAIIKSTGGAAKVSEKQVGRLSTRLSLMAGVDDELIQTGANLLLTFKNVRNEAGKGAKIFDRATGAALDLSATGFGSMDSSSKMLGKALNDPLKGITALSRAGVTFTQGQQDQIKALVEQGDLLKAQKIILGEVESQVGGVAKAQATWSDKAGVYIGNIQEKLGTALLPVLEDTSRWFVRTGGPALEGYVRTFRREGVPALRDFVDQAKPIANRWLPKIADTIGDVAGVTKTAAGYAGDLVGAFLDAPPWVRKALVGGGLAAGLGSKLGLGDLIGSRKSGGSGLMGLVSKAKPLPVFITNPGYGGTPGTTPGGGGKPTGPLKVAGAAGLTFASVGYGAYAMGQYLGNRPIAPNPESEAKYKANVIDNPNYKRDLQATPITWGMDPTDPMGGLKFSRNLLYVEDAVERISPRVAELNGTTGFFAQILENIGKTPVDPTFTTPGLPESKRDADTYKATLDAVGKPISTKVNVDTSAAQQTVNTFMATARAALANLVPGGPAPAAPSTPKPRQADPVAPPTTTPRRSSRGGVDVGGMTVHVHQPSSNVEVEDAIVAGIERYERDRYERGNP